MQHTVTQFSPEKLMLKSRCIGDIVQAENEMILSEVNSIIRKSIGDMRILINRNHAPDVPADYERMLADIKREIRQTFTGLIKQNATLREKVKMEITRIEDMQTQYLLETHAKKNAIQSYGNLLDAQTVFLQLAEFVSVMAVNHIYGAVSGFLSGERKVNKQQGAV